MEKQKDIDQIFKVPNDAEGEFFISLLKKYATHGVHIKVRGRKPNAKKIKKAGLKDKFWEGVPKKFADELGIYLQCETESYHKNETRMVNIGLATTKNCIASYYKHWLEQKRYETLMDKLKTLLAEEKANDVA